MYDITGYHDSARHAGRSAFCSLDLKRSCEQARAASLYFTSRNSLVSLHHADFPGDWDRLLEKPCSPTELCGAISGSQNLTVHGLPSCRAAVRGYGAGGVDILTAQEFLGCVGMGA